MGDRYYPELPEKGEREAQELIDKFKAKMKDAADEVLGELYCDVAVYIESDSWTNFRNEMMDGYKDYKNGKIHDEYNFKDIRQQIYKENREEIIKDLNQDNLKKIEDLEEQIEWYRGLTKY